jgi:hypothetical protein
MTRQISFGKSLILSAVFTFCLAAQAAAQNPFSAPPIFHGTANQPAVTHTVTITQPGVYVLGRDIRVSSGDGIVITASGVTLDLNGRSVTTDARGTGRGIAIVGATGVEVKNGRVGGFMMNVQLMNSTNVTVRDLRITGAGLAPNNGPSEIGVVFVNSRGAFITRNTVTNVNLGMLIRGIQSTGNRISENTLVGGANPANNLLGICYNPAPGADAAVDGPRGDVIYNNHIARFGYAIAISEASAYNIFSENTLASFVGAFREPQALTTGGGTNLAEGNLATTIPMTMLTNQ